MNKLIILLVSFISVMPLAAQNAKNNRPKIVFESETCNLGTIAADTALVECKFKFTNTGKSDLYIHQVIPTCNCTTASAETDPIKPGESSYITITYDGRHAKPGHIRKRVTVHCNAVNELVKLFITGKLLPHSEKDVQRIDIEE